MLQKLLKAGIVVVKGFFPLAALFVGVVTSQAALGKIPTTCRPGICRLRPHSMYAVQVDYQVERVLVVALIMVISAMIALIVVHYLDLPDSIAKLLVDPDAPPLRGRLIANRWYVTPANFSADFVLAYRIDRCLGWLVLVLLRVGFCVGIVAFAGVCLLQLL